MLVLVSLASFAPARAQPKTPDYIRADRGAITKHYGAKIAGRIFSDEFTLLRAETIKKSVAQVPGWSCPAQPTMAIMEILPYPVAPESISWVERYALDCQPLARRNLMLFIEGEKSRAIELLPGETKADPRLQRDALRMAKIASAAVNPPNCEKSRVTDTREVDRYKDNKTPWSERWKLDLCDKGAEVDLFFTPTSGAGTTFTATLVK